MNESTLPAQSAASPFVTAKACRSSMPAWAGNPVSRANALHTLQQRLTESQWSTPAEIIRRQARSLAALLAHAGKHSPYYRELFGKLPGNYVDPLQQLRDIPVLHRQTLQGEYARVCADWPLSHGQARALHTSGSSGQPVRVRRTDLCQMFWQALTLRDHLWHQRDFSGTLASIRVMAGQPVNQAKTHPAWGGCRSVNTPAGPMHVLPVATDVVTQAHWLAGIDPHYVLSHPSNLFALLQVAQDEKLDFPRLREIRCFGETVSDSLRQAVLRLPGVRLTDLYSAQEVGVIALQCPASGLYHIQAESLLVEILDEHDAPCRPGETGRVVITDLNNYATPLIRYELGDYAEVGPVCPCGRGLPTLRRILGRRRNLLRLPNGQRHWPHLHDDRLQKALPGLRQWQLVQHTLQQIEVRLVVREVVTPAQENALTVLIHEELRYPFALRFCYQHDDMPTRGGKFEAFVCAVDSVGDEASNVWKIDAKTSEASDSRIHRWKSDRGNQFGAHANGSNVNGGLWHE